MKKYLILFLLTCTTSISFSQIHEIGFFVGGTNYIGDIGKENYLIPSDFGFGVVYKYNLNPRIALRGMYTYIPISGDDTASNNSYRYERRLSFTNNVNELAVGIEFNFFDYNTYDIRGYKTSFTPYILAEIAIFNYKSADYLTSSDEVVYHNENSYTLPIGIGFKGRLSDHLAYAVEAAVRFTLVDNLDYTTSSIDALDYEGIGNDHYLFTGISLVYTFGRPACYAPRE